MVTLMGAHREGARVGVAPPPPEKSPKFCFAILRAFLLLFLYIGAFLLRFSHYGGGGGGSFSPCGGLFAIFFLHGRGLFAGAHGTHSV